MTIKEQKEFEKKFLEQFISGKILFGADGVFAPILKKVSGKALQAEMDAHLNSDERSKGNKNNNKGKKKLKSGFGFFDIETP